MWLLDLVSEVLQQSVPNALSQLALVFTGFITVLFVSIFENADALGGVGMGSMIYNILGLSLGCGITSALDTLVSQSTGAGQPRQSGMYLQRAVFIASLVSIPASLILLNTEKILNAIGQDPTIALNAGQYVLGTAPSIWPTYMYFAISAFLRSQRLPGAGAYITWISNGFHIVSCHFFISFLRLGALGAGLALSTTQTVSFAMLLSYVHFARPGITKESWITWEWKLATSSLTEYIGLAMPCAMLMWAEWWCAEVMSLLAGYLGVTALAAHTAVLQIFILIYMTSGGISCAGAALVGYAIGSGDAVLAKRTAWVSSAVMLIICILFDLCILVSMNALASLFTRSAQVYRVVVALLHILLVVVPLDSLQTVLDGILRGLGKQALAFRIKLVCMWCVRFPLAILFGFHAGLRIEGIWWGSAAGLGATMAAYLPIVLMIDWDAEVGACNLRYRELPVGTPLQALMESPLPGFCRVKSQEMVRSISFD